MGLLLMLCPQDWARTNKGDKEVDEAIARGEDPGVSLVSLSVQLEERVSM